MYNLSSQIYVVKDETLQPTSFYVVIDGEPIDLEAYDTVEFHVWDETACPITDIVAQSGSDARITLQPTKDFTVDTTEQLCYSVAHGLQIGMQVELSNSGGALPTGLATSTRYYVVSRDGHYFGLSKRKGGSAIALTTAGTGTHSFKVIGHGQYDWQSSEVSTAGTYAAEVILTLDSESVIVRTEDNTPIVVTITGTACDT